MIRVATIILLTLIFLGSGLDKIFHFDGFMNALRDYVVLPVWSARFIAVPLIVAEILIGFGLLFKPWRPQASLAACGLLVLFSLVLGLNYILGGRGMCGCWFTLTLAQGTVAHVAQNLILAGLSFTMWLEFNSGPGEEAV